MHLFNKKKNKTLTTYFYDKEFGENVNVPFKNIKFVKLRLTLQTWKEKQQELKILHHTFRVLWSRHKKSGHYCDRSPRRRSFWTVIHSKILFIDFLFF